MKPAAPIAFIIALAVSSSACGQGVGLRLGTAGVGGDIGWWIAPTLGASIEPSATRLGLPRLDRQSGLKSSNSGGMIEQRNAIAPYLGIGYGSVAGAKVSFYFDLGVIYQDSAGATDASGEHYGFGRSLNRYNLYPVGQVRIRLGF